MVGEKSGVGGMGDEEASEVDVSERRRPAGRGRWRGVRKRGGIYLVVQKLNFQNELRTLHMFHSLCFMKSFRASLVRSFLHPPTHT